MSSFLKCCLLRSIGCILGFVYGYSLGLLGAMVGGAGHGTTIFYDLGFFSFPLGVLQWAVIGGVLMKIDSKVTVALILILVALQYGGIMAAGLRGKYSFHGFIGSLQALFWLTVAACLWAGIGQTIIWYRLLKGWRVTFGRRIM
jgi:hypothetical protein